MSSGCRLVLKLDVSVDELMDIQKAWKASGVGSLKQYTLLLLRGKAEEFKETQRIVEKGLKPC